MCEEFSIKCGTYAIIKKNMLKKIKRMITTYKVGRQVIRHLIKIPEFEIRDKNNNLDLRKSSNYVFEYLMTIHSLTWVDKGLYNEISIGVDDREKIIN